MGKLHRVGWYTKAMKKPFKEKPKMYIVRKYIKAKDLKQALRLEPKTAVHDCWIDNDWRPEHLASAIGFTVDTPEDYDS